MAVHPLLPAPSLLSLDGINVQNGMIVFAVHSTASTVSCPLCRHGAQRPHSRYRRTVLDLPWQGNAVRIEVTCRKFFCDNRDCSRRIFAEPLPTLAARYSRKTTRLLDALRELVYLAGGEAAARIARAFGLLVSPDALLNHIRRAPSVESDEVPTPRVLGIDDFAFRRGHRYGTVLVDLERHCPVDLLPDREPETVVNWLQTHPGVQIVSRDRGKAYIEGATRGAPQATQVTDRWHLLKNLGDVLERFLSRHHRHLREAAGQMKGEVANNTAPAVVPITKPLVTLAREPANQERNERHGRREATFRQVRELYRQGCNQSDISRQTGLARQTVRKYLKADTCPQYPEQRRRSNSTVVAPFASYLKRRWQAGLGVPL